MDPFKLNANQSNTAVWIKSHFFKRECVCVCPTSKDSNKCGCGRYLASHYYFEEEVEGGHENPNVRWSINKCTATYPTEEFGTLAFQGVHGSNKSHFIRLDFTTEPADIYRLLTEAWGFEPPKLVITVHGGTNNFELPHNLSRALRKGLLKAAKTTNAWIITSGIRMGVVKHVVAALTETVFDRKQKFTVIGILPWGVMRRNEELLGSNGSCVPYYLQSTSTNPAPSSGLSTTGSASRSRMVTLCEHHSCFLLVDNGTVGRSGAELFLRRRFEDFVKRQPLVVDRATCRAGGTSRIPSPLVCLVLGGGKSTLQAVLANLTAQPPVPAVVCAGSGRAADILVYARKQHTEKKETSVDAFRQHVARLVAESFSACEAEAQKIVKTVLLCSKWLNTVSIFSCDKDDNVGNAGLAGVTETGDLDCVIMNTLLNGHNLSAVDKLGLLLTWNRDDMAREIFERGNHEDWPEGSLNQAMMYALIWDRVHFVQLLLNNGMAVDKFLTIARLEDLYNTDRGPPNTLRFIVQDVVKEPGANYRFKLPHVGLIVEKLMGSGYRATYSRQDFRRRYKLFTAQFSKRQTYNQRYSVTANQMNNNCPDKSRAAENINNERRPTLSVHSMGKSLHFQSAFDELFIWAVLTKRHEMAMCMWRQGNDQMAKALVGYKLNKELAKEAEEDYLELEISQQFKNYSGVFQDLSYDMLETCYKMDDALTLQLLTYELKLWSRKTCLSLAALSNHKKFIAHPCCQMLLADLWLGGLRIRKKAHLKVILSILVPPLILCLPFKTQEQLLLQAQTAEEFHENRPELTADDECSYASDSSSDESSDGNDSTSTPAAAVVSDDATDVEAKLSFASSRAARPSVVDGAEPPSARPSRLSSLTSANLKPMRKLTISATKTSLQNEMCDFAVSSLIDPLKHQSHHLHLSHFVGARNSSEFNMAAGESEPDSPLVSHRRLLPQNRAQNGLRQPSRVNSSLGFGSILSRHMPRFNRHPFDTNVSSDPLQPQFSVELRKISLKRTQELSLKKKIREFYQAPIACFWSFVICYLLFLIAYTYTVLVKTPEKYVYWPEYLVFAFIFTFGCDQIRRVLLQEPNRLMSKWKVYSQQSIWDVLSCVACLMFILAFTLRISEKSSIVEIGRVLYCCNIVFWYMRCLHLLTASSLLGPFITMYGKMVVKMFLLSNILFVVLVSFGVFRQSILFPHSDWDWKLVRSIVYKPYFMLYGELYAEEIDPCTDRGENCVPGHYLVPFMMTIYLLLAIIVFVNMMIAAFNFVFLQVNSQSNLIWKFQRFEQVMEYEQQPFLPPPLVIFAHIHLICKYVYKRIWKKDKIFRFEHSLKLFLSETEVDKLHDFERECVEHMFTKRNAENLSSTDERVKQISEKLETMAQKMDAMYDRCSSNRFLMLLLQEKLNGCHLPLGVNVGAAVAATRNASVADPTSAAVLAAGLLSASSLDLVRRRRVVVAADSGAQSPLSLAEDQNLLVGDVGRQRRRHRRLSLTDEATDLRRASPTSAIFGRQIATAPPTATIPPPVASAICRSVTWTSALEAAASPQTSTYDGTLTDEVDCGDRRETPSPPNIPADSDGMEFAPLNRHRSNTNQSLNSGLAINLSKKSDADK